MFDPQLCSPENIGNKIDFDRLRNSVNPIAFIVNGFGGCAPCITRSLHQNLQLHNIDVCDLDWNDIYSRKRSLYLNFSDKTFINDMVNKVIPIINPQRPIIAIGHSLGANALLKIAREITPRKIAFLGILDAVKSFGMRSTIPVSSNVEYLYSRWTKNPSLPHNFPAIPIIGTRYKLGVAINAHQNEKLLVNSSATYSDLQEQSYGYYADGSPIFEIDRKSLNSTNKSQDKNQYQTITHGCKNAIYKDLYIQQQMFDIIQKII